MLQIKFVGNFGQRVRGKSQFNLRKNGLFIAGENLKKNEIATKLMINTICRYTIRKVGNLEA